MLRCVLESMLGLLKLKWFLSSSPLGASQVFLVAAGPDALTAAQHPEDVGMLEFQEGKVHYDQSAFSSLVERVRPSAVQNM